jgi:hypothetical protein
VNRRGFLKLGGATALLVAGGSALTMWRAGVRYQRLLPPGARPQVLSEKELAVVCALCDRIFPDATPSARDVRVAERIDRELSFAGARLQRDVKNAIFLVEHGSWARLSSRFTAMEPAAQDAYLERMATAPGLSRQAFAGLREMAVFFYYVDERTWPSIQYPGPLVTIPSPPEADSALIKKLERKG